VACDALPVTVGRDRDRAAQAAAEASLRPARLGARQITVGERKYSIVVTDCRPCARQQTSGVGLPSGAGTLAAKTRLNPRTGRGLSILGSSYHECSNRARVVCNRSLVFGHDRAAAGAGQSARSMWWCVLER